VALAREGQREHTAIPIQIVPLVALMAHLHGGVCVSPWRAVRYHLLTSNSCLFGQWQWIDLNSIERAHFSHFGHNLVNGAYARARLYSLRLCTCNCTPQCQFIQHELPPYDYLSPALPSSVLTPPIQKSSRNTVAYTTLNAGPLKPCLQGKA